MRKPYQKPMLYVERFELSEHIATGCEIVGIDPNYKNLTTAEICSLDVGLGQTIFAIGTGSCGFQFDLDDPNSIYCYHNPDPTNSVFSS